MILLSLLPSGRHFHLFLLLSAASRLQKTGSSLPLENKAQDTADKIDIMLRGQKQEVASMATTFSLIYPLLWDAQAADGHGPAAEQLLHQP